MNPFHDDAGRFDFKPDGDVTPIAGKLPGGRLPPFKLPKPPDLKPPKVPPPPNPPGMVRNDLGKVWGRRPGDTKAMADALDKAKVEQLQAGGFTKDLAQQLQNLYTNELVRNPANQAAAARSQFLKRYLELSK